ncbi:MAG: DUF1570 domain-containing protein [Phycisphaerales bacterium]|nr:DUF1570 domain-containing protein [Phycisphaerales bacterium]MBT7171161.1 DUF1570 domain-containing protein [Phycisphaerales bacterium]
MMNHKNRKLGLSVLFMASLCFLGNSMGVASGLPGSEPMRLPKDMKRYVTKYYTLYTDKPKQDVVEAAVRLRVMAELYHRRTKSFGGVIHSKLDFYMFQNKKDYNAAGAPVGSAGVYKSVTQGNKKTGMLLAVVSSKRDWSTVQHEGFHQFVHMAIGGEIPIWVNEGLAEYFGDSLWTGDSLQTGIIQPRRQKRIVKMIKEKKMVALETFLSITRVKWNAALNTGNYDYAWAFTHFLVHAEDGKYRDLYAKFISDISRGRKWHIAWKARFGIVPSVMEKKFHQWWLNLPENAGKEALREWTLKTMVSYLARAQFLRLKFTTAEEFFTAARGGKLKLDMKKHFKVWLPESLLTEALKASEAYTWKLEGRTPRQKLILIDNDASVTIAGEYRVTSAAVKVSSEILKHEKKAPATNGK